MDEFKADRRTVQANRLWNSLELHLRLPDVERIVAAIRRCVSTKHDRAVVPAGVDRDHVLPEPKFGQSGSTPFAARESIERHVQPITVPVMGEGIRSAKIVSLLKQPGESIQLDDELCEVETDKAVMEIEASGDGILAGVMVQAGAVVPVVQTIAWLVIPGENVPTEVEAIQSGRHMTVEPTLAAATQFRPPSSLDRTLRE